ncbi:MAG: type IV pilus secretin PilQ [Nitrospirae bacterium]|nr:type IV pilus secretin PilQ [Nitrospirota bacterium]
MSLVPAPLRFLGPAALALALFGFVPLPRAQEEELEEIEEIEEPAGDEEEIDFLEEIEEEAPAPPPAAEPTARKAPEAKPEAEPEPEPEEPGEAEVEEEVEEVEEAGDAVPAPAPAAVPGAPRVEGIAFATEAGRANLTIQASAPLAYRTSTLETNAVAIDLEPALLKPELQAVMDVSAYRSVVGAITPTQNATTPVPSVRILVSLTQAATPEVKAVGHTLLVSFQEPSAAGQGSLGAEREIDISAEAMGAGKIYTGPRVSLDFKEIDIDNVLRLLAEVTGINVVADEDVTGKVTLRLADVPSDQALDVILQTKGLARVEIGDRIFRIAPRGRVQEEQAKEAEIKKVAERAEPLVTKVIQVNYANAAEFEPIVKDSLLSERGKIKVEERSNSLIVKDVQRNVDEVAALVRRLDVQTPQVMIDAKVVEANKSFLRTLGSQIGTMLQIDQARGVNTGPIAAIQVGGTGVTGATSPAFNNNFVVDFPATEVAAGRGVGVGLSLGTIGNFATVNYVLSALKESGQGRIVASPRVTALDNKKALILQGESIVVVTQTAQGSSTTTIEAYLRLTVTPHITWDGSVLLNIKLERNELDFSRVVGGIPTQLKREAETELLVKNGETVVIGGVQTQILRRSKSGVPILSDIPIIGMLFRSSSRREQTDELIMFLTPRILNFKTIETVETIAQQTQEEAEQEARKTRESGGKK